MNKAVSQPDQMIADVDGLPRPVLAMQGFFAVTILVIVLNIVVNQRGFVKGFNRHRHTSHSIRNRGSLSSGRQSTGPQCGVPRGDGNERAKPFSTFRQPFVGDIFGEGNR